MFSLEELEKILKIEANCSAKESFALETKGFSFDTRKLQEGEIFVCLKGEKNNGSDFLNFAIEKNPSAILINSEEWSLVQNKFPKDLLSKTPVFVVNNTLKSMGEIAHLWRKKFSIPVFSVTGSNGKTTTKDILASVLNGSSAKAQYLSSEASYNNDIGLPVTLAKLNKSHKGAVLELGMNDFGELSYLSKIAEHGAALITNIGLAHLARLKDLPSVLKAKAEVLETLEEEGVWFLNLDDPYLKALYDKKKPKFKVVTYSMKDFSADYFLEIKKSLDMKNNFGSQLIFGGRKLSEKLEASLNIPGIHNAQNSLAAFAVAVDFFQHSPKEVAERMAFTSPSSMRSEFIPLGKGYIFNDSYNANLNSIKAAIEMLAQASQGNFFLALGEILELGERAQEIHWKLGKFIAQKKAKALGVFGSEGKTIAQGAIDAGMAHKDIHVVDSPEDLAPIFSDRIKEGGFLLVKGSRGTRMERLVSRLLQEGRK